MAQSAVAHLKEEQGELLASKKLRAWMAPNGVTQVEAAKEMGMSEEMLSRYLNKEHTPGLAKAKKVFDLTEGYVEAFDWLS